MRLMLRRVVTAPTPRRLTWRVSLLGAACAAVLFIDLGAAGRDEPSTTAKRATDGGAEPVLGAASPTAAPEGAQASEHEPSTRSRRRMPVVVQALAPGQTPEPAAGREAGPPAHIARENMKLRRELKHLRALEAERRRVSRALAAAGVTYGTGLDGSGRLIWPLSGPLTSPFGQRWGRLHAGIDISAPGGTPIRAADSGRVALAGWQGGYGLYTCVRHTSALSTCYAHQSRLGTSPGAAVRQGQVIGYVGNTGHSFGNHLHFETWVRGRPVDPMGFL
jgi:murein DD-endopeptidase MepM/ murein hydrolase activator NlpD